MSMGGMPIEAAAGRPIRPVCQLARARQATHADTEELTRPCNCWAGTYAEVEAPLNLYRPREAFLARGKEEATTIGQAYTRLKEILGVAETE